MSMEHYALISGVMVCKSFQGDEKWGADGVNVIRCFTR